jgi:hypothetical protein
LPGCSGEGNFSRRLKFEAWFRVLDDPWPKISLLYGV